MPLIRAGAAGPILRWMHDNGRDVAAALRAAPLEWYPYDAPLEPIPLRSVTALLRYLGRDSGPDSPCRVVGDTGVLELGRLTDVAIAARTPYGGFKRAAAAMPYHCTHEVFTVRSRPDGCTVTDAWLLHWDDDETLHLVQQYVAALVDAFCGLTGASAPRLTSIRMTPHPVAGFAHLSSRFARTVSASRDGTLEITVPAAVADRPFPASLAQRRVGGLDDAWGPLGGEGGMAPVVRLLVAEMLPHVAPSIDLMAAATGLSRRTLQRRLAQEGLTFREIVDEARRDLAVTQVRDARVSLEDLASNLGYSQRSTLTRAFYRWTGRSPKRHRS